MNDHDDRVDLQQGILSTDEEPRRLVDFLDGAGVLAGAWERVHRFAQRWATPDDVVHDAVSELWLELDMAITDGPRLVREPSVFAVLDPSRLDRALSGAQAVLEILVDDEQATSLGRVVSRLHRECSGPARVSHIGLMLGRRSAALRVHISELPLRDLHRYLQRIGWGGDAASTEALARTLLDHGDLLVLCLDIAGELTPSAGLECFFAQRHGVDPRWRALLERLTTLGLCAPEKAEALLRWPGTITPIDGRARWPEELLVQSLTRPPDVLSVMDRRLSHVKLVCPPDAPSVAKAYFGYLPVWVAAREQDAPLRRCRPVRPAPTRAVATRLGLKRLLQMRSQGGWWQDFVNRADRPVVSHSAADSSDEWATAYVANVLASIPLAGAQEAARQALELLLQRWDYVNGWGYHVRVPPDADTTTWVLRLARTLGEPMRGRLASGRRLIESLTSPDGGVATYAPSAVTPLARFQGIGGSYAGWCAAHTCVTAAAAMLRLTPAMESYLRSEQRADGSWTGYWWYDAEYATARAVEALAGQAESPHAVRAGVAWCSGRVGADGGVRSAAHGGPSPFATALALHAIRVGSMAANPARSRAAAYRAERWLLQHQLEDGSWEPSAHLRIPPPSALDPEASPEGTTHFVDDRGTFTTATALAALSAAQGTASV